jgi:hypothetical protein
MACGVDYLCPGSSMRNFHVCLQNRQWNQMTAPGVGFGMRWMTLPLHTGQCVGRRGGADKLVMFRSVAKVEPSAKFMRQNAAVQTAPPFG